MRIFVLVFSARKNPLHMNTGALDTSSSYFFLNKSTPYAHRRGVNVKKHAYKQVTYKYKSNSADEAIGIFTLESYVKHRMLTI